MVTYKIGEQPEPDESLSELVMDLLHSAIVTHIMHWQTESYAQHIALGEFYSEIPDLVDAVVEAYQGKNNIILQFFELSTGYPQTLSTIYPQNIFFVASCSIDNAL